MEVSYRVINPTDKKKSQNTVRQFDAPKSIIDLQKKFGPAGYHGHISSFVNTGTHQRFTEPELVKILVEQGVSDIDEPLAIARKVVDERNTTWIELREELKEIKSRLPKITERLMNEIPLNATRELIGENTSVYDKLKMEGEKLSARESLLKQGLDGVARWYREAVEDVKFLQAEIDSISALKAYDAALQDVLAFVGDHPKNHHDKCKSLPSPLTDIVLSTAIKVGRLHPFKKWAFNNITSWLPPHSLGRY